MQYFRSFFVIVMLTLLGLGCGSSRIQSESSTFRVMTFNIRHGEGIDGKIDVERIAKLINDSRADIVALQEVDRWTERTNKLDIINSLVDLTGMAYAFGKTIDFDRGEYGNGILTRFPIFEERNTLYQMAGENEHRGLQHLILDVRGQEIVLMNTHLDHSTDEAERLASVGQLLETVTQYAQRPVILCGDMNDIPTSQTVSTIVQNFTDSWEISGAGDGFSYPTSQPVKRIDYIFVSKPESETGVSLRPVSARVLKSNASDHLPVVVEFETINQ